MDKNKKVIPWITIRDGAACAGDGTDRAENAAQLCQTLCDSGADELFVWEEWADSSAHEKAMALIREIGSRPLAPFACGGKTRHIDDVKKYLYAGADVVVFRPDDSAALVEESVRRFGASHTGVFLEAAGQWERVRDWGVGRLYLAAGKPDELERELTRIPPQLRAEWEICVRGDASHLRAGADGLLAEIPWQQVGDVMALKQELRAQGIATSVFQAAFVWEDFKLNSDGLLPVVVQDDSTEEVLMVAYMNEEAYNATVRTGKMTYYSRSRQELWLKGETSGHYQYVRSMRIDCDNDTLLARVSQVGAACHTGNKSCFYREVMSRESSSYRIHQVMESVYQVILDRKEHPREGSYTNYLFDQGLDKILKKCGEEATEIVIAAKNPAPDEVKYEIADFLYHLMVLMAQQGITWEDVARELANR